MPQAAASPGNHQDLANRSVVGYTAVPPAQNIRGAAKGEEAPHQGDHPFRQTAVDRMGEDRGNGLCKYVFSAAGKIKAVFINHFSGTFYFSLPDPGKAVAIVKNSKNPSSRVLGSKLLGIGRRSVIGF